MASGPPPALADLPDGTPLAEIAAAHGEPLRTARRWLAPDDSAATRFRPRTPRQPTFDPDRIVALYLEGLTQKQVAAEVGCSVDTVSHHVWKAGVFRYEHPTLDAADIARRYLAGRSLKEIASTLGASKAGVSRALDRAGVQRRPWGSHGGGAFRT